MLVVVERHQTRGIHLLQAVGVHARTAADVEHTGAAQLVGAEPLDQIRARSRDALLIKVAQKVLPVPAKGEAINGGFIKCLSGELGDGHER